jgi:hypothetical protein
MNQPQQERLIRVRDQNERELEAHATQFAEEDPIRMMDDSTVFNNVREVIQQPSNAPHNVSLARVSTYIYRTEVSKTVGTKRIVFPTFASHWAIIVSEQQYPDADSHAYHLTFEDPAAGLLSPPPNTSRRVVFSTIPLDQLPEGAKDAGTTRFSHVERMNIGRAMINAFGTYHRVFWNCQHFARLYLSVITGGAGAFDEWTAGRTSNLFLCAFLITTPLATTNKNVESHKANTILSHFSAIGHSVDEQTILNASDQAITLARNLAIEDYKNNQASSLRMEEPSRGRGFIARALDWLVRW